MFFTVRQLMRLNQCQDTDLQHCTDMRRSSLEDGCGVVLHCAAGGELILRPSSLHQRAKFRVVDDGKRLVMCSDPVHEECTTTQVS